MRISEYKKSFGGEPEYYKSGFVINFGQINRVINKLEEIKERLSEKNVVIYGYSGWGRFIQRYLTDKYNVVPDCLIDNRLCNEYPELCMNESVLRKYVAEKTVILVSTLRANYDTICKSKAVLSFVRTGNVFLLREL